MRHYILNDKGEPLEVDVSDDEGLIRWAKWFGAGERVVKQEHVGDLFISTVFLGFDHRHLGDGPPILWETMIFKGGEGEDHERCAGTREQAEAMHRDMVRKYTTV